MSDEAATQSAKKFRVLIVDDKPAMRQAFSNMLYFEEDLDIIGTAEDGAEAVKKASELAPDVILMDIEMPVMDGITATQYIKRQQPGTLIVAVSSEVRHKNSALQAGATAFLIKPFTLEEVTEIIRQKS